MNFLCSSKRQGTVRALAIVALSALVGVALWLGLGRLRGSPSVHPGYDQILDFEPAREGGHLRPSVDMLVQGERVGQPVRFVTNSKGFRNDREFPYQPPEGTRRILLVGDSYVDGMRTDQERTIGRLLERRLNENGQRTEVLIAGSNNPANAWFHYQEHGVRYHPDLVILGVTLGNDLTWHNLGAGMVRQRGPDGDRLEVVPPIRQDGRRSPRLMLPAAAYAPESWRDPLVDLEFRLRATLAARVYALAQHVPPLSAPVPSRRRNVPAADFMLSLGLFHTPLMYEVSVMHDDFEEVLAGFDALVRRSGSRLLVVLFPLRFQVSERDWRLLVRSTGLDAERFDLEAPNRRIREFCAERGIACLDLLPAFRAAERSGRGPLYRPRGDMHFNDAGQALAAEAIADHLGGAAAR